LYPWDLLKRSGKMKTTITFRHLEPTDALKVYVDGKLSKIDKYVRKSSEAHVVLSTERYLHIAEIKLPMKGSTVCVTEKSADMYQSIEGAIEKLRKSLKKIQGRKRANKRFDAIL
jgi:putative sigma-54 modulation protein